MADTEATIKARLEGGKETADGLEEIADSAENIGEGMEQAADGSQKLGKASADAAKAVKPVAGAVDDIADSAKGASKSVDDLDESLDLNSLPEIKKVREELEKLGPAGKKGLDKLDEGLKEIKKGGDNVERVLGEIITDVRRIGQQAGPALRPISEGFQQLPAQVSNSFDRVYANLQEYQNKLERTGDVGTEELEKIVKSTRLMERAIEQAGMQVSDLPDDVQRAMRDIRQETDKATATVKDLENAWRETEGAARSSYDQFTSLEGILESMGGKTAVTAAKVTVLGFAFNEALGLVRKFNEAAGVSPKIMDDLSETIESRVYAALDNFRDKALTVGQMLTAVATGDIDAFKKSVIEMDEVVRKTQADQLAALTTSAEGWKAHREEQAKGIVVTDGSTEATTVNTTATAVNAQAKKDQEAAIRAVALANHDLAQSYADQAAALALSEADVAKLGASITGLGQAVSATQLRVEQAQAAYDAQKVKVAELTTKYGENSMQVRAAETQLNQYGIALDRAKTAQNTANTSLSQAETAYTAAKTAAEKNQKAVNDSEAALAKQAGTVQVVATAFDKLKIAEENLAAAQKTGNQTQIDFWQRRVTELSGAKQQTEELKTAYLNYQQAVSGGDEKLAASWAARIKELETVGTKISDAKTQAANLGTELGKLQDPAQNALEPLLKFSDVEKIDLSTFATGLSDINTELLSIATNANSAKTALDSLNSPEGGDPK